MKIKSLTWGALLVAIHLIVLFLQNYVPGADIILMLVAPLFSAYYTINSSKRDLLIFVVATLIICGFIDLYGTLLSILPILMSGICYGFFAKKQKDNLTTVYAMVGIELIIFEISILLIKLFYNIDIITALREVFKLNSIETATYAIPLLILYCFASAALMHFILKNELAKFSISFKKFERPNLTLVILSIVSIIVSCLPFINEMFSTALIIISFILAFPIVYYAFSIYKKKTVVIIASICVSFLVISLPLIKFLDTSKILLAYLSMFIVPYVLGVVKYFSYIHFKNVYK